MTSQLRCGGCGWTTSDIALRCPRAGTDGRDHVLDPVPGDTPWPYPTDTESTDPNPFIRYRTLLHAYAARRAAGEGDAAWCDRVGALDDRVAAVDGHGFRITPVVDCGGVTVKDETDNVAGSHKGRHLFGTLLALPDDDHELAVASCGNAAVAAAVIARAAERTLRVFVPTWAPGDVVHRLRDLGAVVEVCPRDVGGRGDPCVARLRAAVAGGAVPFSCQGTDNALALDGGRTLGWELADQLDAPSAVVVQVGGGALAASTFLAVEQAAARGRWATLPRLFAAQAVGAAPLVRAWDTLAGLAETAGWDAALGSAAGDGARFMRPWDAPVSAATGILDDEAYDWLSVVGSVARSGGSVVAVDEAAIAAAAIEGRACVAGVGPTGTAGLAATRTLQRGGTLDGRATVAVVFSGRS